MGKNLDEFLAMYAKGRRVTEVDATRDASGESPFVIVRFRQFTAVVNPLAHDDHLCVDVHPFIDGADATAGVFAMSDGQRVTLLEPGLGTTSYGWPSGRMVAVLIGKQLTTVR